MLGAAKRIVIVNGLFRTGTIFMMVDHGSCMEMRSSTYFCFDRMAFQCCTSGPGGICWRCCTEWSYLSACSSSLIILVAGVVLGVLKRIPLYATSEVKNSWACEAYVFFAVGAVVVFWDDSLVRSAQVAAPFPLAIVPGILESLIFWCVLPSPSTASFFKCLMILPQ